MWGLPTRSASYTSTEVERSIPADHPHDGPAGRARARLAALAVPRGRSVLAGLAVVGAMLLVYGLTNPVRPNIYEHFVWQASAWLEGQAAIRYPVPATADSPGNDYYQDVMPVVDAAGEATGRAIIPFPPLPAVVLLPFVAIWGLATNAQLVGTLLGALDVGLAFWVLGRLPIRNGTRLAVTLFFGLGTVLWYAAMLGTTWFLAHLVALGLTLLAVGVALGVDPGAVTRDGRRSRDDAGVEAVDPGVGAVARSDRSATNVAPGRDRPLLDGRGVLAGFLFGLACTARLTVVFGLPFFLLVGGGDGHLRRAASASLGAALPILGLLAYNVASTGHPFDPAYDYLYQLEAIGYPDLGYHPGWSIEDIRYLPQNLALMLLRGPDILPACLPPAAARGLFDAACPYARPSPVAMSLLLTSPAYLLALPALRGPWGRLTMGAVVAIVAIAIVNLMHFSQGWVQFGYRFSLDFAPFALLLVALGLERIRSTERPARTRLAALLVVLSVAVNAWGVAWGVILGW
ncbi:MAG: hypothetical protein ACXWMX_00040 [Candidatus Limnocylindrales bacterium]